MKSILIILLSISSLTFFMSKTAIKGKVTDAQSGDPLVGAVITIKGTSIGAQTDVDGNFELKVNSGTYRLVCTLIGFQQKESKEITVAEGATEIVNFSIDVSTPQNEVVVSGKVLSHDKQALKYENAKMSIVPRGYNFTPSMKKSKDRDGLQDAKNTQKLDKKEHKRIYDSLEKGGFDTEEYGYWLENDYQSPKNTPLSTFSIDVDKASYANIRRFIEQGQKPPAGSVRIEEMVNYFDYNYPQPQGEHPLSIISEMGTCPWNPEHLLLHIGLQGKKIDMSRAPRNNLVFLIDVSGSMNQDNKLPLVKQAFKLLTNNLREEDRVAIVVYAGAAGMVLPPTSGSNKAAIIEALDKLEAGGSTAGGEGIKQAYKIAKENFVKEGNNRVILASDGDFNVGVSSESELVRLIESKRNDGIFLSVLGFGLGNYKDSKMEMLADKGNGNYAYIDNFEEAKKVFGKEMGGTLYTIAKDVKLQLEFNPKYVESYRLIGYENRIMAAEDFNDDKKDAGELGSGHTVTALYEIIPKGVKKGDNEMNSVDPLRYQQTKTTSKSSSEEFVFVKLRYKKPNSDNSILLDKTIDNQSLRLENTSNNFRFSAAVAALGQLLRASKYQGDFNTKKIMALAEGSFDRDTEGYRTGFVKLVQKYDNVNLTAKKD